MSTWNQSTALWFQEQERTVRRDFWAKLKHFAGQIPFIEDVVAAYYCALDPATPMRVRHPTRSARLLHLSTSCATADLAQPVPRAWFYGRRSRANRRVRALRAYHSCPSRSSGKSARQGATA
jgi:hypothetical protein